MQVETVKVIKDRWSGQPRGFGFFEIQERAEGHSAIHGLGGAILGGRTLKVSKARGDAPIFVADEVIEKAKHIELEAEPEDKSARGKKWKEILDGLDPEDFGNT